MNIEEKYINEDDRVVKDHPLINKTATITRKGNVYTIVLNDCTVVLMDEIIKLLKKVHVKVTEKY
jgi:hypothetical protein